MTPKRTKAAPWAALSITTALLLTGCGSTDETAAEEPTVTASEAAVETTDNPGVPTLDLNTSVPEAYKAAAEDGDGWAQVLPSNAETRPLVGGYYLTLYAGGPGEELSLTGVNADTGEMTITATLPGSAKTEDEMGAEDAFTFGSVHYKGKDYVTYRRHVIVEDSDGLSKETEGIRVYFVEMTDGAEATYFDVPGTLSPDDSTFYTNGWTVVDGTDWEAGTGEVVVVSPEGPVKAGGPDNERFTWGLTDSGALIQQTGFADESSYGFEEWDLVVGDWTVPASSFSKAYGYDLDADRPQVESTIGDHVLFDVDSQRFYANASTQKVFVLCDDIWGTDMSTSPNGRYVISGSCMLDTETGETHDFAETGDRKGVAPAVVTDEGLVYGQVDEVGAERGASVTYDTATKEFTIEDPSWQAVPTGITPSGTLLSTVHDGEGYSPVAEQGVRKP